MFEKIMVKCIDKFINAFMSVKVWTIMSIFYTGNHVIDIAVKNNKFELIPTSLTFIATVVGSVIVVREGNKIYNDTKQNNSVSSNGGNPQ